MKCKSCNEEYDNELFPYCPYCFATNDEDTSQVLDSEDCNDVECQISEIDSTITENEVLEPVVNEALEPIVEVDECKQDINRGISADNSIDAVKIHFLVGLSNRCSMFLERNNIITVGELKEFLSDNDINSLPFGLKDKDRLFELMECDDITSRVISSNIDEATTTYDDCVICATLRLGGQCKSFLESKGIETFKDLKEFLRYNELDNLPIGLKDKRNFYSYLFSKQEDEESEGDIDKAFKIINEELLEVDTIVLSSFGVATKVIYSLAKNGLVRLKHLQNVPVTFFMKVIGKYNTNNLLALEKLLKKSLKDVLEVELQILSEKSSFDFVLMRAQGFTLQDVGEAKGVTRERVRQIVAKVNETLDVLMTCVIDKFVAEKGYVSLQDILDIYDNDDYDKVLVNWCKNCENLEYLDFANIFVKARKKEHLYEYKILELVKEFVGDGIDLYENMEELDAYLNSNGFHYIDTIAVTNLLKKHGYKIYGSYATPGRVSYGYLCAKVIAEKFPQGIRVYDNHDLNLLREYVKAEYGDIGLPDEDRALGTRIFNFLVLSGRGLATALENVYVEMCLLDEIRDYIDKSSDSQIYYSHLFVEFEGMIRAMSNIDNHHFLHGVLMFYYPNEYAYSRDYLIKKGTEYVSERLSDKISAYILEQKKPVHKNELKRAFTGRTDITLISAINESKDVFLWDYNYFYSTQLVHCDDNDLDFLESEIRNLLKEHRGYCSAGLLYERIKNGNQIFLEKNLMKSDDNLYQFCAKKLGEKFMFRRPHISEFGLMEELSVKNVAMHLLGNPDELSYNKYMDMAHSLKWSRVTIGMVFSNIEMDYVRISHDLYIKKDKFDIALESIRAIDDVLMGKKKYDFVSLSLFDDWGSLPNIGFDWNECLLDAVLKEYSLRFKVIELALSDRRYIKSVLVDKDSEMQGYIDVVLHLLKTLGKTEISQRDMLNLLVVNGLAYKVIPHELCVSEKIIFKDEKFLVM